MGLADALHSPVIGLAGAHQDEHLSAAAPRVRRIQAFASFDRQSRAALPQMVAEGGDALRQLRSIAAGQGSGAGIREQEPDRRGAGCQLLGQPQHHRQQPQPLKAQLHGPAAAGIARQGRAKGGEGFGLGRLKVGGKHRPSLAGAWTLMARG